MEVTIRPITRDDAESFRAALDAVARERKFLLTLAAPPIRDIRAFISHNIEQGYPQIVATSENEVVGWADFVPVEKESLQHTAHLGMGVVKRCRGQGIGKSLLERAIDDAVTYGFVRLELEVFSNNAAAIALYHAMGFVLEGTKAKARYIDGTYYDALIMARIVS